MKTYNERTDAVLNKIQEKKKTRSAVWRGAAIGGAVLTCIAVLALVLFLPYGADYPGIREYSGSPYYGLIQKIEKTRYEEPAYGNLYGAILGGMNSPVSDSPAEAPGSDAVPEAAPNTDWETGSAGTGEGTYQEVTDNQVAGVIEGDLIKRTDQYIYYLHQGFLGVYSIAGAESELAGSFAFDFEGKGEVSWYTAETREMYLSEDGTTVTLLLSGYGDVLEQGKKDYFLCLIDVDVSDPAALRETSRVYLTGTYLSSRLVKGKLLLMSRFYIPYDVDYAQPETFVPQIGTAGEMECIPANSIIAPDDLNNTSYTVVTVLDQKTLEAADTVAFLSYSDELYVSQAHIFATRTYTQTEKQIGKCTRTSMTEITCISYTGETLERLGSVEIAGTVRNQYSMDEKNGVLRVVTSTTVTESALDTVYGTESFVAGSTKRNANLYCLSLEDWTILAKAEAFAPEGETVESVRFDGNYAYVCTAEVVTLTDPVYFFDLSDLSNITWKDTGTIDGYSSSLVDFGNGNLLGIGVGESGWLKIEMYRETADAVESVCAYERCALAAGSYKAYYIDRENQLIGLGIEDHSTGTTRYILLGFDGFTFHELVDIDFGGNIENMRGVVIDGWLYLFESGFKTAKLW